LISLGCSASIHMDPSMIRPPTHSGPNFHSQRSSPTTARPPARWLPPPRTQPSYQVHVSNARIHRTRRYLAPSFRLGRTSRSPQHCCCNNSVRQRKRDRCQSCTTLCHRRTAASWRRLRQSRSRLKWRRMSTGYTCCGSRDPSWVCRPQHRKYTQRCWQWCRRSPSRMSLLSKH
jgi:hypothetical protein